MLKAPLLGALILIPLLPAPAVDALSPVERVLGSTGVFDPAPYSDQDLDEEKRFAPASPGGSDLGDQVILARIPDRAPVRFEAETGVFYTDNIANVGTFAENDGWFWANRAGLTWRPRIGDNLFVDSFLFQDIYRYDSGPFDFESTEAGIGLVKIFPDLGDLLVFGRYEFLYLHTDNPGFGIFNFKDHLNSRYHRLRFGAHKVFLSAPRHTAYITGESILDLDVFPSRLERHEYIAHLGYTYHATDRLKLTGIFRASYLDYQNAPREDWHYTAGLEISYFLSDHVHLFASVLYGKNDSDIFGGLNEYEAFQAGVGAGFKASF